MSIRRSTAPEVQALVESLASSDPVKREAAIARLAIIGGRAMDRLLTAYASGDRDTRLAILRTAEAIADPRAIPIAAEALNGGGDLALAGAGVLRSMLDSPAAPAATRALDVLVATALDGSAERAVRRAAFDALQDMPPEIRNRVAEALQEDPDFGLEARAPAASRDARTVVDAVWKDALEGRLPEDPATLREAVRHRAAAAPLSALQRLVEAIRANESSTAAETRREAWRQTRGSIHQALALRGSRVAVYDLRETLAEGGAVPSSFLAALQAVGDQSCLEPLATAWTEASGEGDAHRRQQLESAFQAILKRDKIGPRSAALKRIKTRHPEAAAVLSRPSRTTPRRSTRRRT